MPPTTKHTGYDLVSETTLHPSTTTQGGGKEKEEKVGISAGVASALIFVAVFIAVICIRRRMHKVSRSSQSTRDSDDESTSGVFDETNMINLARQISTQSAKSLELPVWKHVDRDLKRTIKSHLIEYQYISMGAVIGKGQFGMVHEALLTRDRPISNDYGPVSHTRVAIKTLRGTDLNTDTVESFLKEGLIMKDFNHKHVLSLIGVSIDPMGVPLIVLPFMANGNLKKYLMKPEIMITVRGLLQFALQVAQGMSYLAKHKFVHRDLAARNCMIDDDLVVKVADFGLSRDIYHREYYSSKDTRAKLPVKWMAIESLTKALYTSKSDVWSFGVLLWELLTRGATPYPDIPNWEIRAYVQAGNRMVKPDACPPEIYAIMLECWDKHADKRPTFDDVITKLNDVLDPDHEEGVEAEDDDYYNLYLNVEATIGDSDVTGTGTGSWDTGTGS